MTTLAQLLADVVLLKRTDAEMLMCALLCRSRAWLLAHMDYCPERHILTELRTALIRLAAGEPIAHLIGRGSFYGLELEVTNDVLIPRADTELLIETALAVDLPQKAKVVDLGSGSGAIACALAINRPAWHVDAVDISLAALLVTSRNAARLEVGHCISTFLGNWWHALPKGMGYDLVITNPPYIAVGDPQLDPQVAQYEPFLALYAGQQGLAAYHAIFAGLSQYAPKALLICEHGYAQQAQICMLAEQYQLTVMQRLKDSQGHDRALLLVQHSNSGTG